MEGFDGGMSEEDFIALTEADLTGIKAGYRSMAADETNTLADVGRGALHGITDAVDETLQFGAGIQDKFVEDAGDIIGGLDDLASSITGNPVNEAMQSAKDWDLYNESENARFINLGIVDKPRTAAGQFVEDIFQFGTGLVGAGKAKVGKEIVENLVLGKGGVLSMSKKEAAKKTAKKVSKSLDEIESTWLSRNKKRFNAKDPQWRKKRGIDFIDSAVASVVVQDPYEHTLAEVMVENDWVGSSLAEYLASDLDDSIWERRLKNGVEDVAIGMALLPLFKAFKARNDGKVPDADDLKKGVDEEKVVQTVKLKEAKETVESHLNNTTKTDQPTALKINTVIKAAQNDVSIPDYLKNMEPEDLRNVVKSVDNRADEVAARATKEVANEQRGTAAKYFDEKALKAAEKESSAAKSRVKLIYMTPDEFLNLASKIPKELVKTARERADTLGKLSEEGTKWESIPLLSFEHTKGAATKVTGHEGRHRAMALKKAGVETMPVRFSSEVMRWDQQVAGKKGTFDYREDYPSSIIGQGGKRKSNEFPVSREALEEVTDEQLESLVTKLDKILNAKSNHTVKTNLGALNVQYNNLLKEVADRVDLDVSAATKDIEDSLNTVKSHGEYTGEKIIKPEKTFANLSGVKESKGPLKNTAGDRFDPEELDTVLGKYTDYNVSKKMNKEGGCF
mgnify:CR=1 FL=1